MPVYSFECSHCFFQFDQYFKSWKNSGKTDCIKCGNISFKIPAPFSPRIFKPRKFADGTTTPDHIRTHSQEKAFLKSQGITLDTPTKNKKDVIKERRTKKYTKDGFYGNSMEHAFKKAVNKCEQGFKIENLPKQRKIKKKSFGA